MKSIQLCAFGVSSLLALSASGHSHQADVGEHPNWNLDLDGPSVAKGGFPMIHVDANHALDNKHLNFQYSYGGSYMEGSKYLAATVLDGSCRDEAVSHPRAIMIKNEHANEETKKFTFDVEAYKNNLFESSYFTGDETKPNAGELKFCIRVEYNHFADTISYHETQVTLTVDATKGLYVTGLVAEPTATVVTKPEKEESDTDDYQLTAYHCDISDNRKPADLVYSQGDVLQLCIGVADGSILKGEEIYVNDILDLTISQSDNGSGSPASPTIAIDNGSVDPSTLYECREDGFCNILHELDAKFFENDRPGTLQIDGIAKIAIRRSGSRQLQSVKVQMKFALQAELVNNFSQSLGSYQRIRPLFIAISVTSVAIIAFVLVRRRRSDIDEIDMKRRSSCTTVDLYDASEDLDLVDIPLDDDEDDNEMARRDEIQPGGIC